MGASIDLGWAYKLTEEEAREHKEHIARLLGSRRPNAFPGGQPVSFARKHLRELEEQDYYMCEKTDGLRYLLYLHQFVDDEGRSTEAQFLIDRKNDFYHIPTEALHLPLLDNLSGYHLGTILDGELVVEHHKDGRGDVLTYFIFDGLCLDNVSLMNRTYDIRLGKIQSFVYKPWKDFAKLYPEDTNAQPFQLVLKTIVAAYKTEVTLRETLPNLCHGNDGLIFTCRTSHYIAGTDEHILKWKPPHENTVDFRLELGAFPRGSDDDGEYEDFDAIPEIALLVNKGSSEDHWAYLSLTPREWEGFKSLGQQIDHRVIECWRDAKTGSWRPKMEPDGTPRFRDDKTDANYIKTVESVMESIEDAVSEADLIAHAKRIRDKWSWREEERKKQFEAAERDRRRRAAEEQAAAKARADRDDAPSYD